MTVAQEITKEINDELVSKFFPLYLRESGEQISIVGGLANLPRISLEDNETLRRVHLCLTKQINEFIKELDPFLRSIRHTTSNIINLNRGRIKGQVDWKLTIQNRYREGSKDRTSFYCRETYKEYNIPENILLKKLVIEIKKILIETNLLNRIEESSEQQKRWTNQIIFLKRTIDEVEKNVYFKQIDISDLDSNIQIPRFKSIILKSRSEFYREKLLSAYNLWERLLSLKFSLENESDKQFIKEVIEQTLVGTKNNYEKYELYALWKILEVFQDKIDRIALLAPGHDNEIAYFNLQDKGIRVSIYYQTLPKEFRGELYTKIVNYYKIGDNPRSRLPDIIIKFEKSNRKPEYLILEVKFTNKNNYILNSIYKVLGYLKDFYSTDQDSKKDALLLVVDWSSENTGSPVIGSEASLSIKMLKYSNYQTKIRSIISNFEDNRQFVNI